MVSGSSRPARLGSRRESTWRGTPPEPAAPPGAGGWCRAILRGGLLLALLLAGLAVLVLLRLPERLLHGAGRPLTSWLPRLVCRAAFPILGLGWSLRGAPAPGAGAVVANHVSWLDIFALNACQNISFVAKTEVAGWPGIGILARATGTLFIRRDGGEARSQAAEIAARLRAGDRLLLFPEGTSTDGTILAPFKPALFAAFLDPASGRPLIQPVSVVWHAPPGESPRFYGWWGDMTLVPHLLKVLSARAQGAVELHFHPPLDTCAFADRKVLARAAAHAVGAALPGAAEPLDRHPAAIAALDATP